MKIKKLSPIILISLICILVVVSCNESSAGLQNGKNDPLLIVSANGDGKELVFEKKLLDGLMKLLELKQREIGSDKRKTLEQITGNENLTVKREVNDRGIALYTVNARFVPINVILESLASYGGRKIFIDEDIGEKTMSSIVSVFLEATPFTDIIEILVGSSGLESIVSDDIVFITMPAKLEVVSSYDYYKEKAIQVYQMAMIKYPRYESISDAYYELGKFYLASDLPTIALQEFQIIVEKYQGCSKGNISMYNIGKCYELLGDTEKALKSYLRYAKKYPTHKHVGDAYLKAGDLWRKQEDYQKAVEIYKYIMSEYEGRDVSRLAELRLGYTYIEMKEYDSALQVLNGVKGRYAFEEFQDEIEYQIGNCYYLKGEYVKAIDMLKVFITYSEENEFLDDAYYKLADCFFDSENYLAALQLYKGAITEYKDSSMAPYGFLCCGETLRKLKMFEGAEKILLEGVSLHPNSEYAKSMKFERALCLYEDGNFKRAFDVFESISQDNVSKSLTVESYIYAGICLCGEKQYQRALEYYQKALDEDPVEQERDRIFGLMGDCYTGLGELANAVKAYQQEFP
ncbi:MAG: tetratricopeptide repeat protein [Planctomycetes bacterium]|nr:tetratricopeptide repeat protein [Planctomycetota bacterium]